MKAVKIPALPEFATRLQLIESYSEIEEVLRSPEFQQGGLPMRRIFRDDTMIFAEGDRHTELRQRFRGLMSRDAMAYYEKRLLEPVIAGVLDELKPVRDTHGVIRVNAVPLIRRMSVRISAGVTGVDGVDTPERTERFLSLVALLSEAVSGQWTKRSADDVIEQGMQALQRLVDEFLQSSLDRRLALAAKFKQGTISAEELPRDMLMTLCLADDVHKAGDTGVIPYVWRQCTLFLSAAINTTSHAAAHVLVHLDEWIKEHPDDERRLTDPEFLRSAVTETLRLHTNSPVMFRTAVKDLTLSTGRAVVAGEMVALYTTVANRDSKRFGKDADVFNPNRPAPRQSTRWGMTFGMGRHMCFGSNLVIGVAGQADKERGTDGTLVTMLRALYLRGCRLDPASPPREMTTSFLPTYESVDVLLTAS